MTKPSLFSQIVFSKRFTWLAAAILSLVMVCTLLLTMIFLEGKKAEIYERLQDRMTLQAVVQKERLNTWVRKVSSVADEFVNSETLRNFAASFSSTEGVMQNIKFIFSEVGYMQNVIDGVGAFNGLDTVVLQDIEGNPILTNNQAAQATEAVKTAARQVAATGRVMFLPAEFVNNRLLFNIFKPVFGVEKNAKVSAVLWTQVPMDDDFIKLLTSGLPIRQTERVLLWQMVDGRGQLIKPQDDGSVQLQAMSRIPAGFEHNATSLINPDLAVLALTIKIPDAPWFVTLEADQGAALQPLNQQRATVFVIAALIVIALMLLAMVVYWWLLTARYKSQVAFKERLGQMFDHAINAMAKTIEARDPYLAGHAQKVSDLADKVAGRMGYSDEDRTTLRIAARLSGIGKMSVPMELLTKTTRLTDYERSQLQAHTLYAEKILREFNFEQPVADIVGQVHERADGSGYPRQLTNEKIHPLARILALCDVYCAMTEPRSYREKKAPAAAVRELQGEVAKYDAEAFAALLAEIQPNR